MVLVGSPNDPRGPYVFPVIYLHHLRSVLVTGPHLCLGQCPKRRNKTILILTHVSLLKKKGERVRGW